MTVKTTKRVIKKKKGPKEQITEVVTTQVGEEAPVTTVSLVDEIPSDEETEPVQIVELPEETTVTEEKIPESKITKKITTKSVIKKKVGPKTETTEITSEQLDDETPIISVHTTEQITDESTEPFDTLHKPDTAEVIVEQPDTVQVTQVKTDTGDIKTVKVTKRVIKKKKGPKQEVTEIVTTEEDDKAPITTVHVTEDEKSEETKTEEDDKAPITTVHVTEEVNPEETKPTETVELPEETTVEEIETPEGKTITKKVTKRIIKKKKGPKIETTEIVTEQEDDKQPVVSVHTEEELVEDVTAPLETIFDIDSANVVEEPEHVQLSQVRTKTGEVKTVKTTKRVIKKKKGPKEQITEVVTTQVGEEAPVTTVSLVDEKPSDEETEPVQIVELPEETTVKEEKTPEGKITKKITTKRVIKKKVGPKIETTEITSEQLDDETPIISVHTTEQITDESTEPFDTLHKPDTAEVILGQPDTVQVTQVKTDTGEVKKIKVTKRVIKKKKGPKQEVTEIVTTEEDDKAPITTVHVTEDEKAEEAKTEEDDKAPITTVHVTEEVKPEETKPTETVELPEETTVEEIETPEGKTITKKVTKRIIKKKKGPKIETTEIVTEQEDDKQPVISVHTEEELVEDVTAPLETIFDIDSANVVEEPEHVQLSQVRTETGEVKTVKTTKRVIKKKKGPKEQITEVVTTQVGEEAPVTTVSLVDEKPSDEETEPVQIVELPEETTVKEEKTPEGKITKKITTKRVIKKKVGPKIETTEITSEQLDDETPIISVHTTEQITDESTETFDTLHKPDTTEVIEEQPDTVQVTQVKTDTGEVKKIKVTKRVIKKKKGPKQEVTEIVTTEEDDKAPITTVHVTEEEKPEETKPTETVELPEETTIEKIETPEGKTITKKVTKRIIKKKKGPKIETTEIVTEQEDDKQPVVSVHTEEELVEDVTAPLETIFDVDSADVVEEPEHVQFSQVRTETGDVKTVKTTKRVIKKKKGPKEQITEVVTTQVGEEAPVTTVSLVDEKPSDEETEPVQIVELPEETTVKEEKIPEGKITKKITTKRVIKKKVGPKIETTEITSEQLDDETPIISVHTTEQITDESTEPFDTLHKPDTAEVIVEQPDTVQVTQVKTDTGEVKKIKVTKRVIKKKKGPKQEVTEIVTTEEDDKAPITTVHVTEEEKPEETKPSETVELPEETTIEKIETPEGKTITKRVAKRIIKKKKGPKIETTEIVTEQEDDKQPVVSVHTEEELVEDVTAPLETIFDVDSADVVEEPEHVQFSQVRTETGDVKTVKTTKRVIKKKKGPKEQITEVVTTQVGEEAPVTTVSLVDEKPSDEETEPVQIVELPEETTVKEEKTPEDISLVEKPDENDKKKTKKIKKTSRLDDKPPQVVSATPEEDKPSEEEKQKLIEPKKLKLIPQKIEIKTMKISEPQHAENIESPQFAKIKLKKPTQKPKHESSAVTLPKFQLKSRIRHIKDWPPSEIKPVISYMGSVRQNGELSRNVKEAAKLKKKQPKMKNIPDYEIELEKLEKIDFPSETEQPTDTPRGKEKQTGENEYLDKQLPRDKQLLGEQDDGQSITLQDTKPLHIESTEQHNGESSPKEVSEIIKKEPQEIQEKEKLPEETFEKKLQKKLSKTADTKKIDKISPDKDKRQETSVIEKETKEKEPQKTSTEQKDEIMKKGEKENKKPIQAEIAEPLEISSTNMVLDKPQDTPVIEDEAIKNTEEPTKTTSEQKDVPEEKDKIVKKKTKKPKIQEVPIHGNEDEITMDKLEENIPKESVDTLEEIKSESKEEEIPEIKKDKKPKKMKKPMEEKVVTEEVPKSAENEILEKPKTLEKKPKLKLTPIKIVRKTVEISKAQHAENIDGPQFTKLKLKKTVTKPKQEPSSTILPKFQLKSRIIYTTDYPPQPCLPIVTFIGSIRHNGILSRNIKEAAKIKKTTYKQPQLPEFEKTELEKPMFGYEDIIEATQQKDNVPTEELLESDKEDEPEQFTIKPRRPSVKKTEEVVDEVTIKKKLKPIRKSSITLPEITEPENVTFRPKTTQTKEDVEQEFNIQLDSYAEEEISMSSKVKLKPQRQPTFNEEADEASIKFYTEEDDGPNIVEIIESDNERDNDLTNLMVSLKRPQPVKEISEEINSSVTIAKPKKPEEITEITEDVSFKLERKPNYVIDDQEEVSYDVKPQIEQFTQEELSLSSKIKLKPKKKATLSEAADEASIQITQEIEDDSQAEEIIVSEAESDDNVQMVIKRKIKKPKYEVSEIEELSVDLKPKRINTDTYDEEQLTILAKRKPKKPSQIQEADVTVSISREQEFPDTPLDVRSGDTVFAVYSYVAETDEAINLVEGERLYILETTNQDWWFVRKHLTEEKGWVPAQYLMDEANYTLYLQKKLNEKIDKLPVFEKPASEEQAVAPIFVEKLRPKHTPDGSTVQFECQVEGHPRPQITWFRQTAIIKPSQDFQMYYDDDNVATLVIREVFPEDAGTFTCVAKNAAGFASSTTELVVEAPLSDHGSEMTILSRKSLSRESSLADILEGIPPTFSKRPKAQYVDEGTQIFLECRLVAIPEPDIAWFFKGEEIIPDENISIVTESDMHMYCSVLKISNVKKYQEGTYTVLAVNREGEASLPIVLKIKTGQKEKPQVIEPLKNMTIREGESVVLTAQVVGNPQPKVSWYKNNEPIKKQTTKSDGDTHTITILKPKKGKDDGIYTLKAVNSEGSTETSAVITIEEPTEENAEPPLFINRFQEITVKEKGVIKLVARVTGNPVPIITWYRNNQIITPSETVTQNFDGENIELIITNVDSEIDSGDYKCVASNSAGKASHGARVTIDVDKVTFIKNLRKSYEIEEGKTVVLECHTSHTVSTKWYHNNKELSGMDHREIIQEGRVHKLRIKKTKLTDVGNIKCAVKDQETSTKLIVHETIPEFTRKLQDFEVKERDVAILEVEINSETADVFWEKDSERIKPKKNKYDIEKRGNVRKLFIRNTSVHDEGEYTCILRDDACTAEVTVVELPPEIISRLQDQKVSKGNKATFEIELTKGDALVRWFKDGTEIQFSNHMQLTIDGKKQKLKIYDCENSDAGEYSCEVGSDRCTAKLVVEEPSIDFVLRLPEVIVVPANSDAYLTVEIPDETLDVTWFKKKLVVEDTDKYTLISDVNKRTLIIRKCTEEDQTEYSCMLLDARCSTKLIVEVLESPPRIISYDKEYRVKRGNDVTLLVDYEAIPQPNDEWVVNSKIIKKTKHTKPSIDSKNASLTIKKLEHTDAGVYKLKLENNCGDVEVEISVIVLDLPSKPGVPNLIETSDTSVNICWNEPENNGGSEIQCYIIEYQEINMTEWISIENVTTTQHTIEKLKNKSSYRFRVFAVNEVGVSEASDITEYVRIEKKSKSQAPTVEKPLKDVISVPNEDVELTCIFGGIPQPKVTWFRNGNSLKTAKASYVNRVATLVVNASETTEGIYKCVATNEQGEAETSCTFEVQLKPIINISEKEINQKLRVGEEWSVTASIQGIPKPSLTWYRNGSKLEKSKKIQITTEEEYNTIRISDLERSHTNKYSIEAQNKAGTSTVELTLRVYDKPSRPEGPVIMREISRESVTIEWKPPLDDGGLELTKYAIEKHEPEIDQWVKVADVDKTVETYCIQRLNENCEYMFRIMAQNPIGYSEALESEPIVIKTALDVPSPPLGPLGLYGIDSNSVTVTWYPSERNGGSPILDYSVEVKQEGKKWKQVATVTETNARIEKLSKDATYQFRICARNEIGTSHPYISEEKITIGKTLSPPSQPLNFVVREITSRTVALQWAPPESDGGSPVTNYVVEYKTVKGKKWTKVVTVGGATRDYRVENIREKDDLVFRVSAENAVGVSLPALSQTVRLEKHANVPSPPTAPLEIRTVGNNIVMTSWGTPEWDGGAPLLGYNVAIRDVTKTMWMEVGTVDAHTLKFAVRDLSEDHTYMVRIYARNEIGLSEPLESDEPFKVVPGEDSHADEELGEHTEVTEPTSFSTQTTTSWLRDHNMDADIRSYARGSLLRRDEYFFRIWHYAKQLFK
ncbi:unnamed protein product [Chilo suppressalis]|uniref:Titin-like n=1 Tax=Chilo suppressalis TaxID=168631 RepID=A0ABN8EAU4_CHISP|nr:unnamed protein product [Chilo suppressalis]